MSPDVDHKTELRERIGTADFRILFVDDSPIILDAAQQLGQNICQPVDTFLNTVPGETVTGHSGSGGLDQLQQLIKLLSESDPQLPIIIFMDFNLRGLECGAYWIIHLKAALEKTGVLSRLFFIGHTSDASAVGTIFKSAGADDVAPCKVNSHHLLVENKFMPYLFNTLGCTPKQPVQ